MYQLFTQRPATKKGLVLFPEFSYIRTGLLQESRKVVQHYRVNPRAVKSNHILVRLLDSITAPLDTDVGTFHRMVSNATARLSMSLQLTTETNAGKVFNNVFFGRESTEIIITNTDPFSFDNLENTWKDLEPVKVLRHPHTDTNMVVFRGDVDPRYFFDKYAVDNSNLYVISINVPMLAVQWYMWQQEIRKREVSSLPSPLTFVASYPIVNMIYSYTDYAIFNRFINALHGNPSSELKNQHPFFMINYYDRLDRIMRGLVDSLLNRRLDFATILFSIPSAFRRDMFNVAIPSYYGRDTRQIAWALNIAIMPTIATLLQLDNDNDNRLNEHHKNFLRISLRQIQNDKLMESQLDLQTFLTVKRYLESEIAAYLE